MTLHRKTHHKVSKSKKTNKSLFGKVNTNYGDNWLKKFKNRKIKML